MYRCYSNANQSNTSRKLSLKMIVPRYAPLITHTADFPADPLSSFQVWVIPETNEVFTSYEPYLQRMDFYKQRRFICEITGHSGLTFFEALRSEVYYNMDTE